MQIRTNYKTIIILTLILTLVLIPVLIYSLLIIQNYSDPTRFHCKIGNYREFEVITDNPVVYPYKNIRFDITGVNETGVYSNYSRIFPNGTKITEINNQIGMNLDSSLTGDYAYYMVNEENLMSLQMLFLKPNWIQMQRFLCPSKTNAKIIESYVMTRHGIHYLKKIEMKSQYFNSTSGISYHTSISLFYDFDGRLTSVKNRTRLYNESLSFYLIEFLGEYNVNLILTNTDLPPRFIIPIHAIFFYFWILSPLYCTILIIRMRKEK